MYNHNKAQQSKNRVHISWDILYDHHDHHKTISYLNRNVSTMDLQAHSNEIHSKDVGDHIHV